MLIAATFGQVMTAPGQAAALSVFIDPVIAALDISRSDAHGTVAAPGWRAVADGIVLGSGIGSLRTMESAITLRYFGMATLGACVESSPV